MTVRIPIIPETLIFMLSCGAEKWRKNFNHVMTWITCMSDVIRDLGKNFFTYTNIHIYQLSFLHTQIYTYLYQSSSAINDQIILLSFVLQEHKNCANVNQFYNYVSKSNFLVVWIFLLIILYHLFGKNICRMILFKSNSTNYANNFLVRNLKLILNYFITIKFIKIKYYFTH